VRRTTDLIRFAVAQGISVAPVPAGNGNGVTDGATGKPAV